MMPTAAGKSLGLRLLKRAGAGVALVAVLIGAWVGFVRISGNFHAVEQGAVYRSAQLSGAQFARRIRENGVRTILNLRGTQTDSRWYDDEVAASEAAHVQHIDYPISAGQELTDDQVNTLVGLLRNSPRPILIHCEAGADRSGLVAALYKLLVQKSSRLEASQQLSFFYGHFPWLGSRTIAMDRTFERVASRQALAGSSN